MLRDFCDSKPERRRYTKAFDVWFKIARKAHWRNFQDTRATFGQTDTAVGYTGRTATIFDIGGNKYRVIAVVNFEKQALLIEEVWTHEEYSRENL